LCPLQDQVEAAPVPILQTRLNTIGGIMNDFKITGVTKIVAHHSTGATVFRDDLELMAAMRGIDRHTLANALGPIILGCQLGDTETAVCVLHGAGADAVWVLRDIHGASLDYDYFKCPECGSEIRMDEPFDPVNDLYACAGPDEHHFSPGDFPGGETLAIFPPHGMVLVARFPASDGAPAGIQFFSNGELKGGDA
jgi:hypothetical protein